MYNSNEALEALCTAVGPDGPGGWAVFDGTEGDPSDFSLRPDLSALLGWSAPAETWALGLIAGGTARSLDANGATAQRCRVACVIDRRGRTAARIDFPDGGSLRDVPEAGRALDVLRRCLDLPTAEPVEPVRQVLTWLWFLAVAAKVSTAGRLLEWDEVIALHPVLKLEGEGCHLDDVLEVVDDESPRLRREHSASVVAAILAVWTWQDVRETIAHGPVSLGPVTPALAAWMDDGMVSRWLADTVAEMDGVVTTVFDGVAEEAQSPVTAMFLTGMATREDPGAPHVAPSVRRRPGRSRSDGINRGRRR